MVDNRGLMDQAGKISFSMYRAEKNQLYYNQCADNLKQARQNLSQLELDGLEYLPDYTKPLSIREFEILHLASYGLSNLQIAELLSISSHTVKSHFDHIFNKLGLCNRTMAVVWATRQGLI